MSFGIGVGVELALHFETCFGRGRGNQIDDDLVADQGHSPPILADE